MQVSYLGCVLDKRMSCEPMAVKVINKINGKLKFLFRKNRYLTKELCRMLCNALIQPHFDYACPAWYPNLNEKTKMKIQVIQNKCIRFFLNLGKVHHIFEEEFKLRNWLPISKKVDKWINGITYDFVNTTSPYYLNEIFEFFPHCRISTRNNFFKLKNPFCKTNTTKSNFLYWSLHLEQLA